MHTAPPPPPRETLADLLDLLTLEPLPPSCPGARRWAGRPQRHPEDRVFGGLLLAQALAAAGRCAAPNEQPIALQADFLRAAPTDGTLTWQVDELSGPPVSTRRSTLLDGDDEPLFVATSRWATDRDHLPSFGVATPAPAPNPEELPRLVDRFGDDPQVPTWWRMHRPVDFRHAEAPPYTTVGDEGHHQTTFLRAEGELPDRPALRAAICAYVTDMSILEPSFRALRSARHAPGSRILSLTHALVFHAVPDLSGWHQFDCEVRAIAHGRALGTGELFDSTGRHVATATQLGLVKAAATDGVGVPR